MVQLTQRHQQRQRRHKTADLRAIVMRQRLPEPGDPRPLTCTGLTVLYPFLPACAAAAGLFYWCRYFYSASVLPMQQPQMHRFCCTLGDPARTDVQPADMTWTIRCDDTYTVTVGRVGEGSAASFGYVVCESDKCVPCPVCEKDSPTCCWHHSLPRTHYTRFFQGGLHSLESAVMPKVDISMLPCWLCAAFAKLLAHALTSRCGSPFVRGQV